MPRVSRKITLFVIAVMGLAGASYWLDQRYFAPEAEEKSLFESPIVQEKVVHQRPKPQPRPKPQQRPKATPLPTPAPLKSLASTAAPSKPVIAATKTTPTRAGNLEPTIAGLRPDGTYWTMERITAKDANFPIWVTPPEAAPKRGWTPLLRLTNPANGKSTVVRGVATAKRQRLYLPVAKVTPSAKGTTRLQIIPGYELRQGGKTELGFSNASIDITVASGSPTSGVTRINLTLDPAHTMKPQAEDRPGEGWIFMPDAKINEPTGAIDISLEVPASVSLDERLAVVTTLTKLGKITFDNSVKSNSAQGVFLVKDQKILAQVSGKRASTSLPMLKTQLAAAFAYRGTSEDLVPLQQAFDPAYAKTLKKIYAYSPIAPEPFFTVSRRLLFQSHAARSYLSRSFWAAFRTTVTIIPDAGTGKSVAH